MDHVIRPFCLILMWRPVNENQTLLPSTERPSRFESKNFTSCEGLFMACRRIIVAIWSVVVKYASSTFFVVTYAALCLPVFQTEIYSLVSLMLVRIVPISLQIISIELTSQSDLSTSRRCTLDSLKRNCIRVDTLDLESQKRSISSLCVAVLSQILFPQIYAMQQNPQLVISHDTDKYEKTSFVYLAHQSDCHGANEHYIRLV